MHQQMKTDIEKIPTEDQWADWQSDMELKYAHQIFSGKSNKEIQEEFYRSVIERSHELRLMPEPVFQYYMLGFRDFVTAQDFSPHEAADAASCFLDLTEYMLKNKPDHIKPIINELVDTIEFVSHNQSKFEASKEVYGDFLTQLSRIRLLM